MAGPRLVEDRESTPRSLADAAARLRHVFVRDLVLDANIGVWKHERGARQRVRINLDLSVYEGDVPLDDKLVNVVRYDLIVNAIRRLLAKGHVNLVETLAERVAALCLEIPAVRAARVRIEKLDVYPDAESVGVEIERRRP
jgi:7,8-dihydroneopterin aldolase/epimerase/oxygenase